MSRRWRHPPRRGRPESPAAHRPHRESTCAMWSSSVIALSFSERRRSPDPADAFELRQKSETLANRNEDPALHALDSPAAVLAGHARTGARYASRPAAQAARAGADRCCAGSCGSSHAGARAARSERVSAPVSERGLCYRAARRRRRGCACTARFRAPPAQRGRTVHRPLRLAAGGSAIRPGALPARVLLRRRTVRPTS
jgi:hypothetical protein